MADKLVPVRADTAVDFMKKARAAIGGKRLGFTKPNFSFDFTTEGKSKQIKTVTFKLSPTITRATWAGKVKEDPDDENARAISKVEDLIEAHEEAHRDGYQEAFKKLKAKFEKDLVGKTKKDLDDAVAEITAALKEACEKLHRSGGDIDVDARNGKVTVKEGPEGAGGCTGF